MKPLTLLMLSTALFTPLLGVAEEFTHSTKTLTTSLRALGYPKGFVLEKGVQPEEYTLLIHLPKEMHVMAATLHLFIHGSSQISRETSLSVTINELPPQFKNISADRETYEWQLKVPASELSGGQLKVTVRGNISPDFDHCTLCQPTGGVVHILPDSTLVTLLEGLPVSLHDAWLTLPDEVVVTIPRDPLSEKLFKAALDWVTLLRRQHHTVRITTLPDIGNLVVAPESDIIAAMAHASGQPSATPHLWDKSGSNIGIVNFSGGAFIAATAPYADVQRFASSWLTLTHPSRIDTEPAPPYAEANSTIPLDELGMSSAPALLGRRLQWSTVITPWNLPPGMRPESATLQLQLPRTESQKMLRIFTYINNVMVHSESYAGDGEKHEFTVFFRSVPRSDAYQLRVAALNEDAHTTNSAAVPIRITPHSYLNLAKEIRAPEGLSSMPAILGHGFDLYIPRDYLANAPRYLPLLGQLLAGFVVTPGNFKMVVLDSGRTFEPERIFITAGDMPPEGTIVPLHFDEGRVQLVDNKSETLISDHRLRLATVIQLVKTNDVYGLWLHPGELDAPPAIDALALGRDDIAIYEPDRLLLSVNSRQEDLARPQYFESPSWYELLYEQRVMWLMFAWVMLTLGVIYLYAKSKQQRKA